MSKLIDLTGKRFGRLTVLEREMCGNKTDTFWKCKCDCGNIITARGKNLRSNHTRSCGCYFKDRMSEIFTIHGMSDTTLYNKWISMRRRCYDPSSDSYKAYGGRGIKVCDEWKNSFQSFYDWVQKTRSDETLTLERIDYNGDYCPENCTWISQADQNRNKRNCHMFTYNGEEKCLSEWCKELGLKYKLIYSRIFRYGMSFEEAITKPLPKKKK